jgi:uncharacterized protein with gpF-like domain
MKKKQIILPPIHPNAGVGAAYQARLLRLIDEMHNSMLYWLTRDSAGFAHDATPAKDVSGTMKKLSRRWMGVFNRASKTMAQTFVDHSLRNVDNMFKRHDLGIKMTMTDVMKNAVQASAIQNVALIKSIPQQYLADVEVLVMQHVSVGGNLKTLTDTLVERYGITRRRAIFIARDQNSKATAMITRARQEDLGITEAIWLHSHGGREPRPDHVAADGKRYKIAEGMKLDDGWVFPGELYNCRCVSKSIVEI